MRHCDFQHVADLDDGRKEWHCPHCDLRFKVFSERPPISECSGDSPVEVIRSAVIQSTVDRELRLACVYRGEKTRFVKCGLCGARDLDVQVYQCALHGECTLRPAKPKGQRLMRCCLVCRDLTSPEDAGQ